MDTLFGFLLGAQPIHFNFYSILIINYTILILQIQLQFFPETYSFILSIGINVSFCCIYNIKIKNLQALTGMLKSSTPDGLAPLDSEGLLLLTFVFGGGAIVWAILNLLMVARMPASSDGSEKAERTVVMSNKILRGMIGFVKLVLVVSLLATIMFFVIIMGAMEHWEGFYLSLGFLGGAFNAAFVVVVSVLAAGLVQPRIVSMTKYSLTDAYLCGKKMANFTSYFHIGLTIILMVLFVVLRQWSINPTDLDQLHKTGQVLLCAGFGSSVVAISMRVFGSIYALGVAEALRLPSSDRVQRDDKHPIIICKAIGESVSKSVVDNVNHITYLISVVGLTMYMGSKSVIGADQNGQIIFELNVKNSYLPIISFLFALFFALLFNIASTLLMRPTASENVRMSFKIQTYASVTLLIGFQALAAYLALPVEFFLQHFGDVLKHPYYAYLCILFGMMICVVMTILAQVGTNHPYIVDMISRSCISGAATNVIYGLSYGYGFNVFIVGSVAGLGYCCAYWLGGFGVGLMGVGFLALLPVYMNISNFYSYVDNASYISYVTKHDENTINSLIQIAHTRKQYEPHISMHMIMMLCVIGYPVIEWFILQSQEEFSLRSATMAGLFLGAMFPNIFSYAHIVSVNNISPVLNYDISMQISEVPAVGDGTLQVDFIRSNQLYAFQCLLSIKYFSVLFLASFLLLGLACGNGVMIGFLCGLGVVGVQMSVSGVISGSVWAVVKKEISMGNVRDDDGNVVRGNSEWGKAAEVGSQVGVNFKDMLSLSINTFILYLLLLNSNLSPLYHKLHQ